jgi:hypothetical protein
MRPRDNHRVVLGDPLRGNPNPAIGSGTDQATRGVEDHRIEGKEAVLRNKNQSLPSEVRSFHFAVARSVGRTGLRRQASFAAVPARCQAIARDRRHGGAVSNDTSALLAFGSLTRKFGGGSPFIVARSLKCASDNGSG